MNIRFYGIAAAKAVESLVAELGLESDVLAEMRAGLHISDAYTRFRREQLEGARLAVRGGVLDADKDALIIYLEMMNEESSEIAATYRQKVELIDLATRKLVAFPEELIAGSHEHFVELAAHGRPRSLEWGPVRIDVTVEALERRGVRGFEAYSVQEEDCDEHGFLRVPNANGLTFLGRMQRPFWGRRVPVVERPTGERLTTVTAETRHVLLEAPRVGDTIRTYSAHVRVEGKIHERGQWTFNVETGSLLGVSNQVNLAFDLAARRSTELAAEIRQGFETDYYPDLK
jgi:acyl-CoA thioesterase FadM